MNYSVFNIFASNNNNSFINNDSCLSFSSKITLSNQVIHHFHNLIKVLVFLLLAVNISYGNEIDEQEQQLLSKLDSVPTLEEKASIYKDLSEHTKYFFDKNMEYAKAALRIGKQLKDKSIQGWAYYHMGKAHYYNSQYNEGITYLKKGSQKFKENADREGGSYCIYYIARCYRYLDNYELTNQYYHQNLALNYENNDLAGISYMKQMIAVNYTDMYLFDSALIYMSDAERIIRENGYDSTLLFSHYHLIYKHKGELMMAKNYLLKSTANKNPPKTKKYVHEKGFMTDLYYGMGMYDTAMIYALEYLEGARSIEWDEREAFAYVMIAQIQLASSDLDDAMLNIDKALQIFKEKERPYQYASTIQTKANIELKKGNTTKARKLIEQTIEEITADAPDWVYMGLMRKLAEIHVQEGKIELALTEYQSLLQHYEVTQNKVQKATVLFDIAEAHQRLKNYTKALQFGQQSLGIIQRIGFKIALDDTYKLLSETANKAGRYQDAYNYRIQYEMVKDSLINVSKNQTLAKLQTEFYVQEKDIENQQLKDEKATAETIIQQRTTIAIVSIILLLGSLLSIYHFLTSRKKIRQQTQELKKLNITLAKTNQELERSNADLGQFAYAASHDLQEPLRAISSFVGLLEEEYEEKLDEEGRQYINFITDGTNRMSALIEALLTYSQVGKSKISKTPVSPRTILDNKLRDLSVKIQERNAAIITNYNNFPETLQAEPNQLGIIFYNLVNNGIKFNQSPNPKVYIDCKERPKDYLFTIRDNGIGIDPKNHGKIFEIFKRLHRKEEFKGTGIGLASVKRIIEKHEGEIWLESELGQGTTFYFSIPK